MARTAAEMVTEAKARIQNLSVDEVKREQAAGAVLVDLREPEERRQAGAIPGAVHAPRGMLEFYADPTSPYHQPEFDPDARIILHCAAGGRSALAADTLQQMGYTHVKRQAKVSSTRRVNVPAWRQVKVPAAPHESPQSSRLQRRGASPPSSSWRRSWKVTGSSRCGQRPPGPSRRQKTPQSSHLWSPR